MSKIPRIDTLLRNFEDKIEGAESSKIYDLIDDLRTDLEDALDDLLRSYGLEP
jgi:uncharacterized protein YeeX (DUF496 family)